MLGFTGLATGLDTDAIISALLDVRRIPMNRLADKQDNLKSQSSRLANIKGLVKNLQDAAKGLNAINEVLTTSASSADGDIFTASSKGGAAQGQYAIHVSSLANAERTYTNEFAESDQTGLFGTGNFTIKVGDDDQVSIAVTASDTLETLVGKINESDADVTASLIFDGENYRIQVNGNKTGEDHAIAFGENGTTLGLTVLANEVQEATNAEVTIDGLITVSSSTNTITDAVPGVTLSLKDVHEDDEDTTLLTVESDPDALQEKIEDFVSAYNAVQVAINKEYTFTGEGRPKDSLQGDSSLRNLQSTLRSMISGEVEGFEGEEFATLHSIGVKANNDGTLKFDTAVFTEVFNDDPEAVSKVLAADPDGGTEGVMFTLDIALNDYIKSGTGALSVRISSIANRVSGMDDQIDDLQRRLDKYQETLQTQFTNLETVISGLQGQASQLSALFSSF